VLCHLCYLGFCCSTERCHSSIAHPMAGNSVLATGHRRELLGPVGNGNG
jgi:hypothetical protein